MVKGECNAYIWHKSKDGIVTLMIEIKKQDFNAKKMYKKQCEVNFYGENKYRIK